MEKNINLNSYEGYIRQIIGWREFMRGIYQNYSEELESKNFFNHKKKMKKSWYDGSTGIPLLTIQLKTLLKMPGLIISKD